MIRIKFPILLAAILLCTLNSCVSDLFGVTGKGTITSEPRTATDFQSVEVQTSANVTIKRDTKYSVQIEDYENLLPHTNISVVNHVLIISITPVSAIVKNSVAKVTITMPDSLLSIVAAGSGSVVSDTTFKDIKTLITTSSGSILLNKPVNIKELKATILSDGQILASGICPSLICNQMGSGKMNLINLQSSKADCQNYGTGDILVNAISSLKATISASGNIYYKGSPQITKSIKGSGVVAPYTN